MEISLRRRIVVVALIVLAGLSLVACPFPGVPGEPGRNFLALNWTYGPQAMNFPAFPQIVTPGEYVQHAPGDYFGEYISFSGWYYNASYYRTVLPGTTPFFGYGDNGDDVYGTLWLYDAGPVMVDDFVDPRSVGEDDPTIESRDGPQRQSSRTGDLELARSLAKDLAPVTTTATVRIGDAAFEIEVNAYDLRETFGPDGHTPEDE